MGGYCGDGEPVALYKETQPKARTEHRCGDCGRGIHPGEVYVLDKYVYDGAWHTERTCLACEEVFKFLWGAGAECLYHGQLSDYIADLSPHDFTKGGEYEGCPSHPAVEKMLARWKDCEDVATTGPTERGGGVRP